MRSIRRSSLIILPLIIHFFISYAQKPGKPIIDVHLHAYPALQPTAEDSTWIPLYLPLPETDEALLQQSLEQMEKHNIVKAIVSGSRSYVAKWHEKAPEKLIRGVQVSKVSGTLESVEKVRGWIESGIVEAFGEFSIQYSGMSLNDEKVLPYVELLEELNIPLLVHMGLGPKHGADGDYTVKAGDPLTLEPVLAKFPNLRVIVMHAGWPLGDNMIAMLHSYPQIYVGTGVINWYIAKPEFYRYLQRIVEAGFGDRVVFGSDQMHWPDAISLSIQSIDEAPFLSEKQKRDIFYNNAARFFRFTEEEIEEHHR